MTTRNHAITVALDRHIRDDDIEPLLTAIRQMRGVTAVTAHPVEADVYAAEERADRAWREKLYDLLKKN